MSHFALLSRGRCPVSVNLKFEALSVRDKRGPTIALQVREGFEYEYEYAYEYEYEYAYAYDEQGNFLKKTDGDA